MFFENVQRLWMAHRNWVAVVFFASVVTLLSVRTLYLLNEPGHPDPSTWGMRDYRDAIYYPVTSWIDGNNPYDARSHMERYPVGQLFPLYSPLTLIIHLPLGLLPFVASEFVYFALCIVTSVLLSHIVLKICQQPTQAWSVFGFAGLILLSRPGHMNQVLGQTALQAVLFTWLAIYFADRKAWIRSGVCVMLASFKPTFGILLIPLLIAKRQYKAALAGLVLTALFTGIMGLTILDRLPEDMTLGELLDSNEKVFQEHAGVNSFSTFSRDDVFPLINKIFHVNLASRYERLVTILFVTVSSLAIWFGKNPIESNQSDGLVNALICVTIIVAIYHHTYDTIVLCLPWLAVFSARHSDWRRVYSLVRRTLLVLLTVPAINYLSTNTVTSRLAEDGLLRQSITSINGLCLLVAWTILVACCCVRSKFQPEAKRLNSATI